MKSCENRNFHSQSCVCTLSRKATDASLEVRVSESDGETEGSSSGNGSPIYLQHFSDFQVVRKGRSRARERTFTRWPTFSRARPDPSTPRCQYTKSVRGFAAAVAAAVSLTANLVPANRGCQRLSEKIMAARRRSSFPEPI